MKDKAQGFAIRKDRRALQWLGRILASLFKVALLMTALGFYWRWNHGDLRVGPIFLSERKLAAANAAYFVSTFGLLGSAALIVTTLKVLRGRAEVRLRKQTRQIQPRKFTC
jgi:fatty acid desaturase